MFSSGYQLRLDKTRSSDNKATIVHPNMEGYDGTNRVVTTCRLALQAVGCCNNRRVNYSLGTTPTLSVEVQSTIYTFLSLLMWPCHKFWTFRPPWHVDDLAWSKRYQIFLSAQVSIHIGHKREVRPSGWQDWCHNVIWPAFGAISMSCRWFDLV